MTKLIKTNQGPLEIVSKATKVKSLATNSIVYKEYITFSKLLSLSL